MKTLAELGIAFLVGILLIAFIWVLIFSMQPVSHNKALAYIRDSSVFESVTLIETYKNYYLVRIDETTRAFSCQPVKDAKFFTIVFYMAEIECSEVPLTEYQFMRGRFRVKLVVDRRER